MLTSPCLPTFQVYALPTPKSPSTTAYSSRLSTDGPHHCHPTQSPRPATLAPPGHQASSAGLMGQKPHLGPQLPPALVEKDGGSGGAALFLPGCKVVTWQTTNRATFYPKEEGSRSSQASTSCETPRPWASPHPGASWHLGLPSPWRPTPSPDAGRAPGSVLRPLTQLCCSGARGPTSTRRPCGSA